MDVAFLAASLLTPRMTRVENAPSRYCVNVVSAMLSNACEQSTPPVGRFGRRSDNPPPRRPRSPDPGASAPDSVLDENFMRRQRLLQGFGETMQLLLSTFPER